MSSIWQLTLAERKNAAVFIHFTTVRPFIFMAFTFKCFFCFQYFSEIPALLEHTSTHKPDNEMAIVKNYIPKGKRSVQVDISDLNCKICSKHFHNLDSIREHLVIEHKSRFFEAGNGMTEYKMESSDNMLVCHLCNKSFHNFSLLNSHMNSTHFGKVVCENCGAGFLNQHYLLKHKETHAQKPSFSCKSCDKQFLKKSQLKYHREIVHQGKDRVRIKKCPHCPKTFKEHYGKMVHLRKVHGISKSFDCHMCKATFTMRRSLTEHMTKVHTEKFKCKVCSQCYGTEFGLKQHMRGHTGEKNFICAICKNTYMRALSLRKHILRSHSHESQNQI